MAQIKLAEYTFDSTNTTTNMPKLTPSSITMTVEDTVISDTVTKRVVYIDNAVMPTQIKMNSLGILEVYYLNIDSNITSMDRLFHYSGSLTYVNTQNWDTRNVTSFHCAFEACGLTGHFDLSHLNTSSVTAISFMFCNTKLTSVNLSGWDLSKCTGSNQMFSLCNQLEQVNMTLSTNLSSCKSFEKMFEQCKKLETIKGLDTWNVQSATNLYQTFFMCNKLKSLKGIEDWDVSSATDFCSTFHDCSSLTSLDLRNWVTSSATTMTNMFYGCTNLETLRVDNFDTSKLNNTNMNFMFQNCSSLKSLNLNSFTRASTSKMVSILHLCNGCTSLEYFSMQNYDIGSLTTMQNWFTNCSSLKMIDFTTYAPTNPHMLNMFDGTNCPIYYNSNICTYDVLTSHPNAVDVKGRLMAIYDFNNTVTNADVYPTLTGSSVVNTIDTTGSESYITHRVISVDTMPTAISFQPIPDLLNVDYLAVTNATTDLTSVFQGCFKLEYVNTTGWDTRNVTSMSGMFVDCGSLKSIDLSNLNTSSCTTFLYLFQRSGLETLDLSSWDTSKVEDIGATFSHCTSLTQLDVTGWNTTSVTNMSYTFEDCPNLAELDLTSFNTSNVTGTIYTFADWSNSQIVYVNDTNWTISTDYLLPTFVRLRDKILAKYTFDNSIGDCLPTITGITTGDYITSDIVNGTTTTRLLSTDSDKVITQISFSAISTATKGNTSLLTLDYLRIDKNITNMNDMLQGCANLTIVDGQGWDTSNVTQMGYMFQTCQKIEDIIGMETWDTSKVTTMTLMFGASKMPLQVFKKIENWNVSSCTSFERMFGTTRISGENGELDLSNWTPINLTNCSNMFNSSSIQLVNLSGWNAPKLNNMSSMFAGHDNQPLQSVDMSNWTMETPANMSSMFYNNPNLTSIDFTDSKMIASSLKQTFQTCSKLTSLDVSSFNVNQCTDMSSAFQNCSSLTTLDLSSWDVSKCTTMQNTFGGCSALTSINFDNWNTPSLTSLNDTFNGCTILQSLNLSYFDTSKVITFGGMCSNSGLVNADFSNFTAESCTGCANMFLNCSKLQTVDLCRFKPLPSKGVNAEGMFASCASLISVDISNFDTNGMLKFSNFIAWGSPNISLGLLYTSADTINDIMSTWDTRNGGVVYYHDADPTQLTPVEGVTFKKYTMATTIQLPPHIQLHSLPNGTKDEVDLETGILTRRTQKTDDKIVALESPTTEKIILNYNNSCDYGRILPTGMCDKYDVVNAMYTQTMTSILLDGENTWDAMEEMSNVVKFTATGTTVGVEELNMLGAGGLYCDNDLFPNINDDSDVEHCRVDTEGNKFYIYIDKDRLMSPDLIGWQIWLQSNPFNLIYELAEHLTYVKPYEELDPTQARWEGMDCMRDGAINYHTNSSDNITMYPTLEYVAPSINNFELAMLEPNTDYTVYAEGINENDTINFGGTDIKFSDGKVFTSGDNQWLRIDNNDSFYNMVITKGDTTGEVVPYFKGMISVENPNLLSKAEGGNLFNFYHYEDTLKSNGFVIGYDTNSVVLEGNGRFSNVSITVKLEIGQKYYIGCHYNKIVGKINTERVLQLYDVNNINLLRIQTNTNDVDVSKSFTVPDGADGIIKIDIYGTSEGTMDFYTEITNFFIKKYENGNNYEPFKESTVSYTDLKLRSLPNGVKDTINVVTGEYVQRVGEMIFDNTSAFEYSNSYDRIIFTCLRYVNSFIATTLELSVTTWGDGDYFSIKNISSHNIFSKEDAIAWLQENPITLQYELAEPITTKLDPQTLLAYAEDGTISLSSDTGLLPTTHYTVPSTNTFHLPSMKTGTRYTLKYPSASGSITIGDINYSISSDSMLFTTPLKINGDTSAIIFSDANPENVVLLEGAYNKREVPFFTGVKSVKNPNITIIDQLSTESTTYNCETEIELRGLPNGVADKLDIIKGKLTTNVGIRPYQEGDENLPNIWTDGYETVYALSSPVVTNVTIDHPTVTTNSLIELSSDYLIPQLNYRAPSSNNFPLDLLQPNTTYTLYADTLTSGSYTLGGTRTGVYSQPHTIILGDVTDNLLTFNGDLGLSNVMLVKGNSLKTTLPPYFLGIRSVTDGHLLVEGMAGEINELTIDEGIVLRDCNGVKDAIDLITCTLTKRTGEITLTGAEGWYRADNESTTDYNVFKLTLGGLKEALVMCDTLQSVFDTKMMDCIHAHTNELCIVIANATIGGNTVNALKSWLNQHPTTVVYQLRTPIEVQLKNTWTTLPPTSYDNQTEISSTVSTNSLKPMISVTIATTTLEEIVSNLEAQNTQLEEENLATMLALTGVYELMSTPSVATTEPQVATYGLRRSAEPVGMSVSPMGMVYARLVNKGFKSIDEVPYNLQAEVMYALRGME